MPKMRDKLALRPFEEADFEPLSLLMAETWLADFAREAALPASRAELCEYLAATTWSLAAVREGTLLGAVLLSEKDLEPEAGGIKGTTWAARETAFLNDARARADPEVSRAVEVEMGGVWEEKTLAAEYAAGGAAETDACIKLLVVSPQARGLGLGRTLVEGVRAHLRERGARGYHLLTDDGCDVSFYDHLGLTRAVRRASEVEWADAADRGAAEYCLYVYAERLS